MNKSLVFLNNLIQEKESRIDNTYRLKYHMSPRVGWLNDPNGLIYFDGAYHLYYQANPRRSTPGKMTWGHFLSPDLIRFEDKGIALALDGDGENAYSGGAIEESGKIHIYYTLHTDKHPDVIRYDGDIMEGTEVFTEEENEKRKSLPHPNEQDKKTEEVYHSSSETGEWFPKGEKVFDNLTLPKNLSIADFRDPCPAKVGDTHYIFLGGRDNELNAGVIVVLKGKSLDEFEYAFHLGPYYELGDMAECPCYQKVDGKDVILVSGCDTKRRGNDFRNINCSLFILGDLDFEKGEMKVDLIKEIDKGDSFYAPQFIYGETRPIMVGWMEMWAKKYPTSLRHHGYVGAFSIPRVLKIEGGDILQWPVEELTRYETPYSGEGLPRQADILVNMGSGSSMEIRGDNGSLLIRNTESGLSLDNSKGNSLYDCVRRTNAAYPDCHLRILLDTSSIEIFVEGGKETISSRFYIDGALSLTLMGETSGLTIKKIGERQ